MCIRDSSNGVRVNLKPTEFDKDSINITFAVDGGELSRPEKASGLALFAGAVMNGGGLKDHSHDELAAIMAGKKVGVGFSMTDRSFPVSYTHLTPRAGTTPETPASSGSKPS